MVSPGVVAVLSLSMLGAVAPAQKQQSIPSFRIQGIVVPIEPVLMEDGLFGVASLAELLEG